MPTPDETLALPPIEDANPAEALVLTTAHEAALTARDVRKHKASLGVDAADPTEKSLNVLFRDSPRERTLALFLSRNIDTSFSPSDIAKQEGLGFSYINHLTIQELLYCVERKLKRKSQIPVCLDAKRHVKSGHEFTMRLRSEISEISADTNAAAAAAAEPKEKEVVTPEGWLEQSQYQLLTHEHVRSCRSREVFEAQLKLHIGYRCIKYLMENRGTWIPLAKIITIANRAQDDAPKPRGFHPLDFNIRHFMRDIMSNPRFALASSPYPIVSDQSMNAFMMNDKDKLLDFF